MSLNPPFVFLTSFTIGFVLGLIFLAIGRLATPPRRVGDKTLVYESGVKPLPSRLRYFAMQYFPFIVLYVAFDVFSAYVLASLYYGLGNEVLVALLAFSLPIVFGLFVALLARLVS
ncbi:hypothetical protein PYJP_17360 [Pyrofollis japonicus]|uniref:NADH-quinone oxidoreductase subunit A n=1 Tax=Pyrofollis japonicus TaxID=3060460 RepID=UPI00295AB702|nr:NADH-quinone oxidoreductase subunit A [Pyrofollis japonicus]BEP18384.1 hypothetical protein PYJP_17360 [Pyrofollis japonicus]